VLIEIKVNAIKTVILWPIQTIDNILLINNNSPIALGIIKMKKILLAMFCLFNVNLANAQTIHFDDLVGDLSPVTDGYNGLNWNISNVTGVVVLIHF